MRKIIKYLSSLFLIPLARWYLSKERTYSYRDITIKVFPGVFHPGLFYSTNFLLDYLNSTALKNATFLELGCGTGLISIYASLQGAIVTASDLNQKALDNIRVNSQLNGVTINILYSDLMVKIPVQRFDWIIINPPYYARTPQNEADLAWYAGRHFEYFEKLFKSLRNYIDSRTNVIMVLTESSDLTTIFALGDKMGFHFEKLREKWRLLDGKDFIFRISKESQSSSYLSDRPPKDPLQIRN